jgi:serine/threonine-protein kinase
LPLSPGTHLGPYEVVAQIGEGGMGAVYRATDTNLSRQVALKVLPDAFAQDAERLARFEREAKTLASLNHPHIAAIYGFEKSAALHALVMELVEGDDLSQRIARGAIPVDEALPIAKQIAEALEAAHEQGIIHRDLKPANIKVRPDGTVKVLDFGLAKAMDPGLRTADPGLGHASQAPTITTPAMTQAGIILGTAAYMSPEQAKGRPADRRSDLWAFGCVLYEMLTGRRAFDGDDMVDVLGAVARLEPDWSALPADLPPAVRTLMRTCLTKDRRKRNVEATTALFVLDHAASLPSGSADLAAQDPDYVLKESAAAHTEAAVSRARNEVTRVMRRRVALMGMTAVLTAAIAGAAVWYATHPLPLSVTRTVVPTSGTAALSVQGTFWDLAIAPDGSRIVYQGTGKLLVRALDRLETVELDGLGSPSAPFFSPDGQWIGFFDGFVQIKKVAVSGGPSVPVTVTADGSGTRGATWGEDGTIVYATSALGTGLHRVSAAGGEPTILTVPDNSTDHYWPEFLPGGQAVLFTIIPSGGALLDNAQIAVLDLRTNTQTVLVRGGYHARYVRSGHLVFGAEGTLSAVAFDLDRLAVIGTPTPVVNEVLTTASGAVDAAVAASGTLVYVAGGLAGGAAPRSLVWVDRQGREEPLPAPPRAYMYPRLAPDGTRVAVFSNDQEQDLWVWDIRRTTLTRLTFEPGFDHTPLWMPDGRHLVFSSVRSGAQNLFVQAADGTGSANRLTESDYNQNATGITPDGTHVVLNETTRDRARDLRVLLPPPLAGASPVPTIAATSGTVAAPTVTPLIETRFEERGGVVSPDGRWLAYESTSSGRLEVYVRPFPAVNDGQWQVSTGGGAQALWSRNGRELFYVAPDGSLMTVPVEPRSESWSGGTPRRLLEPGYYRGNDVFVSRQYDVSPDGQRFLMIKEGGDDTGTAQDIIVVQNWLEELTRLVPVD